MYCSVCRNKTDDSKYLSLGVVHPTLVMCSVECVETVLNSLSGALDNVMLPVRNEDIED